MRRLGSAWVGITVVALVGCDDGLDALGICAPVPGPVTPALVGDAMGIAWQPPRGSDAASVARRAEALDLIIAAGITNIRSDFLWHRIEPEQGDFQFEPYDAMVDDALARGVEIVGLLAYGVDWASPGSSSNNRPPDDLDDYAHFAGETVAHFRGRVDAWEIWNEPNHGLAFWRSNIFGDPPVYADMLERAAAAVRAANPDATVVFGGTLWHMQPGIAMGSEEFIAAAFAARPDLAESFDAMAIHPYKLYPPRVSPESSEAGNVPMVDQIGLVRAVLDANGAAATPIWLTEVGWTTTSAVSEGMQARFTVRGALLSLAGGAHTFHVYTLRNSEPGSGVLVQEEGFGLYEYDPDRDDGVPSDPKRVAMGLGAMRDVLGDTRAVCAGVSIEASLREKVLADGTGPEEIIADGTGRDETGLHAIRFESDDENVRVTALWVEESFDSARVKVRAWEEANAISVACFEGEEISRDAPGGFVEVEVDRDPVYLIERR